LRGGKGVGLMQEGWLTGASPGGAGWGAGRLLDGMPGVRTGPRCRTSLVTGGGVRVAVTADPGAVGRLHGEMLTAAGAGRWAELAGVAGRAGGGWVVAGRGEELFVCGDLSGPPRFVCGV
ncbi:Hypothetical protein SCLAV_1242, partial [Streptomyces clavuligerus]